MEIVKDRELSISLGSPKIALSGFSPFPYHSRHQSGRVIFYIHWLEDLQALQFDIRDAVQPPIIKKVLRTDNKQTVQFQLTKGEKKVQVAAIHSSKEIAATSTFIQVFPELALELPLRFHHAPKELHKQIA